MDGVWHLNAPQWTDFQSSPQPPDDDYFERAHEELEPQHLLSEVTTAAVDANPAAQASPLKPEMDLLQIPEKNDSLVHEIEIAKMTPVKVVSPTSKLNKNPKVKETTYDNVLSEAMASLQLSIKKKSRRSHSVKGTPSNLATPTTGSRVMVSKSLSLHSGTRSTPSNPIPMWIRRTRPTENNIDKVAKILQPSSVEQTQDEPIQTAQMNRDVDINNDALIELSEEAVHVNIDPNTETLASNKGPEILENTTELNEVVENPVVNDVEPPELSQPQGPIKQRSNISQRSSYSNKGQQARFSTCQLRRRSLTQYRRRSNKYVSMAEAISKFQTRTPKRFRSISSKHSKPAPLSKVQQSAVCATVPISPALRCKSRTRPTTVLSTEAREQLEIQEIRKNSVRGNLARANSLKGLTQNPASKSISHKPATVPDTSHSIESITSNANPEKKVNREARIKVTVPSVISTNEGIAVKDAEISNFGVPDITSAKQSATKFMPFSFETRNKELQKKKEQKIKALLTEEERKIKVPFHARPVPAFKKPILAIPKEANLAKTKTKPCPFSFEERDKNLVKKKENFIKSILEEDKKARIFQAKPIPEFKAVLVRGVSKENLNTGHKLPNPAQKSRISMLPVARSGSKNCLLVKTKTSDQENQNPRSNSDLHPPKQQTSNLNELKNEPCKKSNVKVLTEFHLNTDKRAKERKEFDERIKQKEQEVEILKKDVEAENLKRQENERAEIRRMAETKARPMPTYKPPVVIHSDKPLTEPQSPGWAGKPKR